MGRDDLKDGILRYDRMVESALRQVVRQSLEQVAEGGLPDEHHFYITFRTDFPGVEIPRNLHQQYPDEMTIVLQFQFWELEVSDEGFAVTLTFSEKPERLRVPFAALTAFADPAVRFGLQFETGDTAGPGSDESGTQMKLPDLSHKESPTATAIKTTAQLQEAPDEDGGDHSDVHEGGDEKVVTLDRFRKK